MNADSNVFSLFHGVLIIITDVFIITVMAILIVILKLINAKY